MTVIIDYEAGNIRSVANALHYLGEEAVLSGDPAVIRSAERLILPGVGAFGDAMDRIRALGLEEPIRSAAGAGTPMLGICLGLQLLFEESEESPGVRGLSLLPGVIRRIPACDPPDIVPVRKVPQIGWNDLRYRKEGGGRLFRSIPEHSYVYFVHSYYLQAEDPSVVTAVTDYGVEIHAAVESGNLYACQFHPEKSERTGLQILRNFLSCGGGVTVC